MRPVPAATGVKQPEPLVRKRLFVKVRAAPPGASVCTARQRIAWPVLRWRGSREIEHLGSAHDEAELEVLKAAAQQRMAAGQLELGFGLGGPGPSGPLPVTSSRMSHLTGALECGYRALGPEDAAGGDGVFRHLVLARIIEPVSNALVNGRRVAATADVQTELFGG
jgi:hypothetical protein